ncbi:MAG: BamA/TamA family outer membrane protein [Acidobacteria bacterium]|nr:BamA/TamA family outer membrane protein [Acidobacteriota bacterium]
MASLYLAAASLPLGAQQASESQVQAAAGPRLEQWAALRERKAEQLRPPERSGIEKFLYNFRERRVMERFAAGWNGFHPKFGGMHTGSGFAAGPEYRRERLLGGVLDFRVSGALSTKRYEKFEFQIGMPRLLNEHLFLDFAATSRNYPREPFYGLGPKSLKKDRTSFRLEDTTYLGTFGVRWRRWLSTGIRGGIIASNTGRGKDPRFPSTERLFHSADAPALDAQPDHYRFGAFAHVDYRDQPGNPRSGGNYILQWNTFGDRSQSLYSFRRYEAELQQYVPFFNRRRVIAFRAKSSLTDTSPGQTVPFYMQETVGGSEDLRGFREFRFRDRNLMAYNLEYRWEVFSGLDMALFGDAGKVFSDRSDFNLERLEGAYGIGLRFNQEKAVFLRIDVGKSREGVRVFFKFGHVF